MEGGTTMSEALEHLNHMGLPAAVLQALLPCSPSLRPPEPPRRAAVSAVPDVDRYTSGTVSVQPEPVVTELRAIAERHQAHQAARLPEAA
jgi:hypothetical protein